MYENIVKPNFHAVIVKNAALNQYFSVFWVDGSMGGTRNYRLISLKFGEFVEKSLFIIYANIQSKKGEKCGKYRIFHEFWDERSTRKTN
jgi:hypothetical protein